MGEVSLETEETPSQRAITASKSTRTIRPVGAEGMQYFRVFRREIPEETVVLMSIVAIPG